MKTAVALAILVCMGCGSSPPPRPVRLTHIVIASPCSDAERNLGLAARAGRGDDTQAMLAMLADGRVYAIQEGTQVDVSEGIDNISIVYMKSGSLIGKTMCAYTRNIG